jgi:nucleoid-associated protein YgaU
MLMAVLATAFIAVVGLAVGGGAQAANHGRNGAGYQGMHQIVVQPGDTLWSIASRAEPSQDPRLVITEIQSANSLSTDEVRAGQVLWVPK